MLVKGSLLEKIFKRSISLISKWMLAPLWFGKSLAELEYDLITEIDSEGSI